MHDSAALQRRLAEHAVSARYGPFIAAGGILAAVGLGLFAWALFQGQTARAWQLFHVAWLYFTGLAGGAVAIVAVHKVTHAKWSGLILRYAGAAVAFFPISFLGFLLIFTVGYDHIFPDFHGLGHGKELWLSYPWMFTRLFIGLGGLFLLGWKLVRTDMIPDVFDARAVVSDARAGTYERMAEGYDDSDEAQARVKTLVHRLAPAYVVVYAVVFSMVAFDMIMALQPHWFSNLLGGFYFMGSFLGGHMLLVYLTFFGAAATGTWAYVSGHQRHDLGKLCFGFSVFWAYLMWSQFLVIWYGNLPEETGFVFARLWGPWRPVGTAVFLGMFIIPFFGLLGVAPKKFPPTLGLFAAVSLLALFLERYLLVLPSVTLEHGPVFGMPEIGPLALLLGMFLLGYGVFGNRFPMVSPRQALLTIEREIHHSKIPTVGETDEAGDYDTEADVERDLEGG
jgi:hypothetical protein